MQTDQISNKICPKCSMAIKQHPFLHFEQECVYKDSILRLKEKAVTFIDQKTVCLRCLQQFDKKEWQTHQKKISIKCLGYSTSERARSISTISNHDRQERLSQRSSFQSPQKPPYSQKKEPTINRNTPSSGLSNKFLAESLFSEKLGKSIQAFHHTTREFPDQVDLAVILMEQMVACSKLHILEWVKQNKKIKKIILQQFFKRFIEKTLSRLRDQIKEPTFDLLEKVNKLKWRKILKDPSDIFDQQQIRKIVSSLPLTTKNKVLRALNHVYKLHYGEVFPKFTVDAVVPQKKRVEFPLKTKDFFNILEQLCATKEKDLVHIAIDFYILFQTPQRIGSDRVNLENGLKQMIEDRKKDSRICTFTMQVKKTIKSVKKASEFIVSEQLCRLLEEFDWKGFYRKAYIYKRMRQIFGFPVYSIKHCVFAEFQLQRAKQKEIDLKNLAAHKTKSMPEHYGKSGGTDINQKDIKDCLKIPNLIYEPVSRHRLRMFLGKTKSFKRYAKIRSGWLQVLKKKLGNYDKTEANFYDCKEETDLKDQDSAQSSSGQVQNPMQILQNSKDKGIFQDNLYIQPSETKQTPDKVLIQAHQYSFIGKSFTFKELFARSIIQYCGKCSLQFNPIEGKCCNFCYHQYHEACLPNFCICVIRQWPYHGLPYHSQKKCNIRLQMPQKYMNKNQDKLNQIIFLLAARRFYYVTTASAFSAIISQENLIDKGVQKIILPDFSEYEKGNYFPPLTLDVSGFKTANGTGFGLFAAEDISKNCFIGQYAADILHSSQALMVRRPDSIFTLVYGNRPHNTIIIGPSKNCGYVPLINGCRSQQANCQSQKVEINGFLKVIVFTKTAIKKGQELRYNYEANSVFSCQTLAKKTKVPIASIDRSIIPQGIQRCGLVNLGNTCYVNSTLQFIRCLFEDCISSSSKPVEQAIFEIISDMKGKRQYNPEFYLKRLFQVLWANNCKLSLQRQEDSHELLLKIIDQLSDEPKRKCGVQIQTQMVCYSCSQQTNNIAIQYSLLAQIQESWFEEMYTNKYQENAVCDCQCGKTVKKRIQNVSRTQDILIIALKRFDSNLKKILTPIDVPLKLFNYKLKCVINHVGKTIQDGHYTMIQIFDDYICKINDTKVEFFGKVVDQQECYILGYSRIND